jgi:hypothetical protein
MKLVCYLTLILVPPLFSQADRTLGTVTNLNGDDRRITLRTDTGTEVLVIVQPTASFRRVAPGETDLQKAATIAMTDISVGDRVLARGRAGSNQNEIAATLIVVMSQGQIAQKQTADRADWDRRGILGIVTMTDTNQITVILRGGGAVNSMAIRLAPNASVRRYSPDSVRFVDARPSTLGEIKVGDQVRARGNRTADGSAIAAEELVFGTFRTIAGTITSLDPQQNAIAINDLDARKPLVVKISAGSNLRKLQPQVAQAIALRVRGGGAERPPGQVSSSTARTPDTQQMIDISPTITLTDLRVGEPIVISSAVGTATDRVTAITLLAGVEPILRRPGTREMSLGYWNLDLDIGAP